MSGAKHSEDHRETKVANGGSILDKQLSYWKQKLQGAEPLLQLPTDRPRPAVQTYNGAAYSVALSKELSTGLSELSRQEGVTLFMTLLAAYQTLLSRYTRQEDILVGSPIAIRSRSEVVEQIGFIVNMLVFRNDLSGDPSFKQLLSRVRETALEAYAHHDLPFEKIVEELDVERSLSYSPLFQVVFTLQNVGEEVQQFEEVFDLSLHIEVEAEDSFMAMFEYNKDLFDRATIARLAEHFRVLLNTILENPERAISELSLINDAEREQLLVTWNETATDYPCEKSVPQLVAEKANATPDAIAVVMGEMSLTYGELNSRANQLAHHLKAQGVSTDSLVGICMERSPEILISQLAVLKAGGAYVPMDPAYPQERLAYLLEDSQVSVFLTQERLLGKMPQYDVATVLVDAEWVKIAKQSAGNPVSEVAMEQLAYVIYTSGSTGLPKGVAVTHGNLLNLVHWHQTTYELTAQDRATLLAGPAFDASVWETWPNLTAGASLFIPDEETRMMPDKLHDWLIEQKITISFLPTPLAESLLVQEWPAEAPLRYLLTGGDQLHHRPAATLPFVLVNHYGPTECTVVTTAGRVEADGSSNVATSVAPNIGRPIANMQVYVLDEKQRVVPIGVVGEMYIGGAGLARGYLNRPDLTEEKFIPHPFSSEPNARLYKTGDLVRYLPDGNIEFIGRIDNQVKIRGFRIELGEIESTLIQHPDVQNVVVLAREVASGDKRLVAYVEMETEMETESNTAEDLSSSLRRYLKGKMPEYMIPSAFILLDSLPMTANGKVDKKALPAPDPSHWKEHTYVAPRNEGEELVANILAEVLQVNQMGVSDNFFERGGHSLLATQVVSRMREAFGVEVPIRVLFELPTVEGLAGYLHTTRTDETQAAPIVPINREGVDLPLSFAQQRLWFLDRLLPNRAVYNIPLVLHLQGDLQADALELSLQDLVTRHETLRTTFVEVNGQPVQVIAPQLELCVPVVDLQALEEEERKAEASRLAQEEANIPFDLATGPLLRAKLLQLSAQEFVLVVNMHHIISDGWSVGVLMREMSALYELHAHGQPHDLPELQIQYADFAVWQREWLQGDVLDEQVTYWKQKLQGVEPLLQLPTDRPRPAVQTYNGAAYSLALSKELSTSLSELSRQEGVTLFMTLLAAYQTLLSRYTRQEDIVVGSPIAGRNRREVEGLIGFFVNTLVLRTDLSGDLSFQQLLSRVRATALEAYTHQDLPFEKIVDELEVERSLSYSPLFQVMFALQNAAGDNVQFEGVTVRPYEVDSHAVAQFDLSLHIEGEAVDGFVARFEYNTDLFDRETIIRMAEHFSVLLTSIVEGPEQKISELALLRDEEREQLLVTWNDTHSDYPRDQFVPALFEQQVEASPDALAVVMGEMSLTYGELNRRANQLAHYLKSQGVSTGHLVGIGMGRSPEMLISQLAVLKAGGAYVPMDPAYPEERLTFLLKDSQVKVFLTQKRLLDKLPQHDVATVLVDADWAEIAKHSVVNPVSDVSAEQLAYVIYTSGSTGVPKGVQVTHGNLLNFLHWHQTYHAVTAKDRTTLVAGPAFDVSVSESWPHLTAGVTLLIPDEETRAMPEKLRDWLIEQQITICFLPTPLAEVMLALEWPTEAPLRTVVTGGDKLHHRPATTLPFVLFNQYGPTEATIFTTAGSVEADMSEQAAPHIGRPIANMHVYVLDEKQHPVPIGVAGELYIGGAGLAKGYLNRPDLTHEKFVPHPFSSDPNARLYKTGDLVRYLPDGNIEFIGRIDNQVKIRGFRIELGEIEANLIQYPDVQNVVVLAREAVPGDKRLVAYVEMESNTAGDVSGSLRQYLKGKIPDYMIPSLFLVLDRLPLTANGKVDKKALPAPDPTLWMEHTYVAPRNDSEELVANIWAEVLSLHQVGVHENFFELGGHSLLATQVVSRMREAFGVEVPIRDLFEYPTVEGLAGYLEATLRNGTQAAPIVPINRAGVDLPLSFAQQRLWFLDRLLPDRALYHIPQVLHLQGDLQVDALERSLDDLIARHEILRTTFAEVNGQQVQVIAPQLKLKLPVIDLQLLEEEVRKAEAYRLVEDANTPFDLATGPLLRVKLLQLGAQEFVLMVNMHHIISDGWSIGVLMREMSALYGVHAHGQPHELPELQVQYADFAVWQREWLQGDVLDEQVSYWKQKLQGAEPLLQLPTDRPRPTIQTHRGALYTFPLSKSLGEKLNSLSRLEGVTLFMTLLTAFKTLLSRYTHQEDLVVGSPIAGRNRSEVEGLIGFFVNTLVLRTDLSGDPSFKQLLARVRETALEAYAHQDLPFEKIVDELEVERSLSYAPLFQVMFALQNAMGDILQIEGVTVNPYQVDSHAVAKFDLSLNIEGAAEDGFTAMFEYNTDLFDRETIARMAGHFTVLLSSIVEDPEQTISELALLGDAEREQLLAVWIDTTIDYPRDKSVPQFVEENATATPDAIAVVMGEVSLTYGELNRRANQLAHYLKSQGVSTDSLVGICMERSPEMLISQLAVFKAGGAYVPMDPAYPQERLAYLLADSQVKVFLTQECLLEKMPQHDVATVLVDAEWTEIAKQSVTNLFSEVTLEHLAYVIYTSGSTGLPKGVQVTHGNLLNLVQWHRETYDLTAHDRATLLAGPAFDASVWETWPHLTAGASLFIPDEETRMMPVKLRDWLTEQKIMISFLPTPLAESLLVQEWPAEAPLRYLLTGGDQLHQRPAATLPFVLVNHYGPTECTVVTTAGRVEADGDANAASSVAPNIGRPIANMQVYVLDEKQHLVPIGVVGELYIGGAGLAKGYLNRPDLTEEKFIPHPFSSEPNARLYKTGDLVRYLPDGNIEFIGRIDNQVKIRGFRIELGEIESTLIQHPDVQNVVVLAREVVAGDKRLVAYVEMESNAAKEHSHSLRQYLKGKMPEYMIPSVFVVLDRLPLTANGKVDKKALPAPDPSLWNEHLYVAPRNDEEELVANIWAEVLSVNQVGVYDNFFERGGHSLLATQVVSRMREAFGVEMPIRALFEHPTVEELAGYVQAVHQGEMQAAPIVPINREGVNLPLSFAQQRLWFLDRLLPDRALYNIPLVLHLQGDLQVNALERSMNHLIARHEILRTTISDVDGEAVQVIAAQLELKLPVIDLQALGEEARKTEASRLVQEDANTPFDLATGPLFRVKLLQLSAQEFVLMMNMHHIISDGWSVGVLMRELTAMYGMHAHGKPHEVPELQVQYADFAVWQREWLQGDVLAEQVSYWKQKLQGVEPLLQLPTDRPRPAVQTYNGAAYSLALAKELSTGISELSRQEGVTLFMTLLAAYQTLLSRYTRREDIVVGSPIAGRNRSEVEGLIGFFVNTLVLRTDLAGDPSFQQLLSRVRETALEAYAHQDLPFEKIVDELEVERSLSYSPLFQVMFALQNAAGDSLEFDGVAVRPYEAGDHAIAKFDLSLHIEDRAEDGFVAMFEYNTDLFDRETIARMAEQFAVLLTSIVEDPKQAISKLALLGDKEREQLLVKWNETTTDYPREKSVQQLYEEQAVAAPDAIAVVMGEASLTYGELNSRANQLAHYLRAQGVGEGSMVGLCMERSLEMIVSLLGILKAGGAYVPLDPKYPKERLAYMMEDSQISALLTQQKVHGVLPTKQDLITVCLDTEWESVARESAANLNNQSTADSLAYLVYTSGSTGKPKGVCIPHRGIVRLVKNTEYADFSPENVFLQLATVSFDAATYEIWGSLLNGAKLVLMPPHQPSLEEIGQLIQTYSVTSIFITSGLFNLMVDSHLEGLKGIKQLFTGGEALSIPHMRKAFAELEGTSFVNVYGPTESTTFASYYPIQEADLNRTSMPIGRPISNTQLYVLDPQGQPVPIGVPGELHIGGDGLAHGYLNRPDLTEAKFIPHPFSSEPNARLYKTGDLVRYLPDGNIEFIGRIDNQVKIRGFRIELGEIEAALLTHPAVLESVVLVQEGTSDQKRIVAYVVTDPAETCSSGEVMSFLKDKLPNYMVPSFLVMLERMPLTPNGKIDHRALPTPEPTSTAGETYVAPTNPLEEGISAVWQEVLNLEQAGVQDNFFDIGGNSLLMIKAHQKIQEFVGRKFPLVDMYKYTTIQALVGYLDPSTSEPKKASRERKQPRSDQQQNSALRGVAIIGMSGRFPDAQDVHTFWQNLADGVESLEFFPDMEEISGPYGMVKAGAVLQNQDDFDPTFFGIPEGEALVTDPQQRLLLETSWEALEGAGYDPRSFAGLIGLYAAVGPNTYGQIVMNSPLLQSNPELYMPASLNNDSNFLTTRLSYLLDLRGPSFTVQSACSGSALAIHLACQALLNGETDMALAGGAVLMTPQKMGYFAYEGGPYTFDAKGCKPFDANSRGSFVGHAVGTVLLKRLDQAVQDGDTIYAVIRGSAVNNDGAQKVGYEAISSDGLERVITEAVQAADVDPATITYVASHAMGTPLGDAIEVSALTEAYGVTEESRGTCAITSIKPNIGHPGPVSGVANVIQTALSMQNKTLPPQLNFETPNPQIDFENSPFYVSTVAKAWDVHGMPLRAGINSFGMGGTNVHLILEEAPEREASPSTRDWHLIVLSAKSASALEQMSDNLAVYLEQHPDVSLADVAYTLQMGRARFKHRRFVVARNHTDAIEKLRAEQTLMAENQESYVGRTVRFTVEGQCDAGSMTETGDLKLSIQADPAALKDLLEQVGELWQLGASIDWLSFYADEKRYRVSLPTYPFERKTLTLESHSLLVSE